MGAYGRLHGEAAYAVLLRRESGIMPTIIERIAVAEADAEALRHNAQEAARTAQTAAEEEAAAALKNAREEAKAGLALSSAMAEKEAESLTSRLLEESGAEAEARIAEAKRKLPGAADLVLDYVINKL